MNGSISLLRANPALTTNVKLMVDTEYNLYLESYSANRELSDKLFKKFQITADSFLSQRIASFYKGLPTDIAFDVKNDIKSDIIQTDYNSQFDDIYYSGGRNVEDTRYKEEFQYNTTLKIVPNKLPKYFMVFRIDGPGTTEMINGIDPYIDANNITYAIEYMSAAKLITTFDLTPQTNIGRLWKKNYIDDDLLLRSPVELNFKQYEFSKWNGYDYYSGGTVSKSFFMNEYMVNQTTPFEMEAFITDGFKKNAVISSHYSNISFLYDDTVAGVFYKTSALTGTFKYYEKDYPFITKNIQEGKITNTQYIRTIEPLTNLIYYTFTDFVPYRRKWTINRYSGFYIDDILPIDTLSPYTPTQFNTGQGIYIVDNVFRQSNSVSAASINPVTNVYDSQVPIYFKIDKKLFLIEFQNNEYVLISDEIYNGLIDTFIDNAQKPIKIEYENDNASLLSPPLTDTFRAYLKNIDNTYYLLPEIFNKPGSIFVIKIIDKFYRIGIDTLYDTINSTTINRLYIQTDDYITCNASLIYRKLGFDDLRVENIQVLTKDNNITYFEIYQLQFTAIGDWDFDREDTRYAGIEYNKTDSVSYNRPFIYGLDIKDTNIPKDIYNEKYYRIWIDDQIITASQYLLFDNQFILPLSSEYAASGDLYMLDKRNMLTRIWDVNQSVSKWGIYESVNNMAYPYSINNSLDVCGPYNFTPSMYSSYVDMNELTLDWFYTLGKPVNNEEDDYNGLVSGIDSITSNFIIPETIIERSLNIDLPYINIRTPGPFNPNDLSKRYKFDIEYYKSTTAVIDYFDYIFNLPVINDWTNQLQYYRRHAYLTESDKVNGPSVFFKGLAAYLQYVDTGSPNNNTKFKVAPADDLGGYAFSVLFSPRFITDINDPADVALLGKAGIEIILNKIYKNILVNIYVYTLPGTYTTLDYITRDKVYSQSKVKYTNFEDIILQIGYKFYDSELPVQSLTLKTITDILNGNKLTHPHYSQGIKYTVVENVDEYPIESITSIYDGSDNLTNVTFNYKQDIPLQHGDWIYLQKTGFTNFDTNHQIRVKNSNRSITITVGGNQTVPVNTMNLNTSVIICTKEKSVYPFRLKVITPDNIKINKAVNSVIGDTSCPVKPRNKFITNTDLLISNQDFINNIPHVYVDDNISRRILKQTGTTELSYAATEKLPSIFRYSGDYEPILKTINLFKFSKVQIYNGLQSGGLSLAAKVLYAESNIINNKVYISVHITDLFNQLYNDTLEKDNIAINDIFYILGTDDFPDLQYKVGHIIDISESTILPVYDNITVFDKSYRITLSLEFDVSPIPPTLDLVSNFYNLFVVLHKYSPSNTEFEYEYSNFGRNDEIIVSKVHDGINPLQTSNGIYTTTNKFPMIDEHGVTTISRHLFKSSWDPDFYYKTVSNKYTVK